MGRWLAIICGILLGAAAGYVVGHGRPGAPFPQTQRIEARLDETKSEVTTLREEKQELQQRLDQITKEQERLAQENEILRKQQVTEEILTGKKGELPALPLK